MPDNLSVARDFAESVRFSGDTLRADSSIQIDYSGLHSQLLSESILVSSLVTPTISKCLENVTDNLKIPTSSVTAYVYASPGINASCFAGNDEDCIIRLTSGLIDILEDKELESVIGHEIGHFLYQHSVTEDSEGDNQSLELFTKERAKEFSADRIGLLASGDKDASIYAMMKVISGLSSNHLKFNVGAFISQLNNTEKFISYLNLQSSHPSMLVRCRALLWFAMSDAFITGKQSFEADEMDQINKQVQDDIDKYVDPAAQEIISELKQTVALWLSAQKIAEDGRFDLDEQKKFEASYGEAKLKELKKFLKDQNPASIKKFLAEKLEIAKMNLQAQIPSRFESEMTSLEEEVENYFN